MEKTLIYKIQHSRDLIVCAYNSVKDIKLYALGLLCSLLFLASCSSDDSAEDNTQYVQVNFTLSLGEPQTVTRANTDWTDYTDTVAVGRENYIDINKLHVCFFDQGANGTYQFLSSVQDLKLTQQNATTYNVIGIMRVDSTRLANSGFRFTGKVVVYANSDPVTFTQTSLITSGANVEYAYTPGSELTSIPMWGVKTLQNVDLRPGRRADISDIWLLRAMAKVEVDLTQDMKNRGYTLSEVYFNKYNTRGYVVPAGYNDVDNTRLLNYDTGAALSFHPLSSIANDSVNFTGKTLYLPEYDNSSEDDSITVVIKNTEDNTIRRSTFPFATYTNGVRTGRMNVVRNHYYKFNVYGNPIMIDLKVQPWTVITHPTITM